MSTAKKPIGKREAYRQALLNAAGLIEAEDLDSLFGGLAVEYDDEESLGRLTDGQSKVVKLLRRAAAIREQAAGRTE